MASLEAPPPTGDAALRLEDHLQVDVLATIRGGGCRVSYVSDRGWRALLHHQNVTADAIVFPAGEEAAAHQRMLEVWDMMRREEWIPGGNAEKLIKVNPRNIAANSRNRLRGKAVRYPVITVEYGGDLYEGLSVRIYGDACTVYDGERREGRLWLSTFSPVLISKLETDGSQL